jgi:D-amino peptidase
MPSLDDSFAGLFQVGCHAMAGTLNAFLDHTQSSRSWFSYSLGGREMGEMGQVAAIAGHYGVPTLLVTGDEAACAEAREFFGDIETVAVKRATGRNHASCLHPKRAQELIREAAARAIKSVGELQPFVVEMPAEVKLTVTRADYVDGLARRPGVERMDARTIRKTIDSALDLISF